MTTNQPNSQAFATAAAIADAQRAATEAERARCLQIAVNWFEREVTGRASSYVAFHGIIREIREP